jgi:hypothetical protein
MLFAIGRVLRWLSWGVSAFCVGALLAGHRSPLLVLVLMLHGIVAAVERLLRWQKHERPPADRSCRIFWMCRGRLCPDEFPSRRVTLRCDKGALDAGQASRLVWICEEAIDKLARWHGSLITPPTVFILANSQQFRQAIGGHCGAICILEKNAIVVPAYGVPGLGHVDDVIRHELAHLFTARWNRHAIPLLNEGFATWWQHASGQSGLEPCVPRVDSSLVDLLDPNNFYNKSRAQTNYALAGSFSGFLIRRFGRERYLDFYQRATPEGFERCVAGCFGLTLAEVEACWRRWVIPTLQSPTQA